MQKMKIYISFLFFLVSSTHCKSEFKGQTVNDRKNLGAEVKMTLNCSQDSLVHSLEAVPKQMYLNTPGFCTDSIVSQEVRAKQKPVDIVFVLDVTQSMDASLETVKSRLVKFAESLDGKNWDAQFAAVAFRDPVDSTPGAPWIAKGHQQSEYELIYKTALGSAADLRTEITRPGATQWIAADKSDFQEGGQSGIHAGIDLLDSSSRAGVAEQVILYVSDAPGYKDARDFSVNVTIEENKHLYHWDFNIDGLASRIKSKPLLKFYHSTRTGPYSNIPGDTLRYEKYQALTSDARWIGPKEFHIAAVQMDAVLAASQKQIQNKGKRITFPLTEQALMNEFGGTFEAITIKADIKCFVQNAEVKNSSGKVVNKFVLGGTAFPSNFESPLHLEFSQPLQAGTYVYHEDRCCVSGDATSFTGTCLKVMPRQISMKIN